MAVKSIKLGQVWRQDATGQDHLVTKVYSEVFTQYAVLRPAEVTAPDAPVVKVKVAKSADGVTLARLQLHAGRGVLKPCVDRPRPVTLVILSEAKDLHFAEPHTLMA